LHACLDQPLGRDNHRVTVRRTDSTGPLDGRIVLGYRSEKDDYFTVGLHSEGRAYQIVHFNRAIGWNTVVSAGLAAFVTNNDV